MPNCAGHKADGSACRGTALPGAVYCWAHDPAHATQRQINARHGGKTAGQGRHAAGGELAELRTLLKQLTEEVQTDPGKIAQAYAVNALITTRLRLVEVERKLKEQDDLEVRLAALEALQPQGGKRWG